MQNLIRNRMVAPYICLQLSVKLFACVFVGV